MSVDIVAISTRDSDTMCYLEKEVTVLSAAATPEARTVVIRASSEDFAAGLMLAEKLAAGGREHRGAEGLGDADDLVRFHRHHNGLR